MNKVREIQRLNKLENEQGISPSASWHVDYRDTAYVRVGGLSFDLTEGDVITIFSQFGEPAWVKLMRDKTTGKSRGFGWVKYEDQRSCDLAVDNLGGATVLGRIISVDHDRYKKRDDEEEEDKDAARAVQSVPRRDPSPESDVTPPRRPLLPEEKELQRLMIEHDDEDPMKEYLVSKKKEEVEHAKAKSRNKDEKRHRHRHDREDYDRDERYVSEKRHRRRRSFSDGDSESDRRRRDRRDERDDRPARNRRENYSSRLDMERRDPSEDDYERRKIRRRRTPSPAERVRRYSSSPAGRDITPDGRDRRRHRHRRRSRSRSP